MSRPVKGLAESPLTSPLEENIWSGRFLSRYESGWPWLLIEAIEWRIEWRSYGRRAAYMNSEVWR